MIHQGKLSWSQVAELMPAPPPPHPSYLRLPNESPSSGLYFCACLLRMRVVALNLNMGPWTRFKFLWSAIRKLLWLFTFPSQLKPFFTFFYFLRSLLRYACILVCANEQWASACSSIRCTTLRIRISGLRHANDSVPSTLILALLQLETYRYSSVCVHTVRYWSCVGTVEP